MSYETRQEGSTWIIDLPFRIDFGQHNEFCQAYEAAPDTITAFVIDLGKTQRINSDALGMFLHFRAYADENNTSVTLINTNAEVAKVLRLATFDKLFDIR